MVVGHRIPSALPRVAALAWIALFLFVASATPAQAQYYGNYSQPYYGGGYYQPQSGGVLSNVKGWFNRTFGDGDGQGIGRTMGGAAGIAAGSFGGAALASAVIKGAGVASMGPIAPILIGTAITAGGAFVGAKLLSHGGSWMDQALGPDMTWTMVGAVAGSVAGFALLPALGPFAGPAGRVLGAAVGGIAGGVLGKMFAPTLQRFATTKSIYAATGAALGGAGFGIPGAVAGLVGGYALGSIMNKGFFSTPGSTVGGELGYYSDGSNVIPDTRWTASNVYNTARANTPNFSLGNLQGRLQYPGNYYNPYYASEPSTTIGANSSYVYNAASYPGYTPGAPVSTAAASSSSDSLTEAYERMRQAHSRATAGDPAAIIEYQRLNAEYLRMRGQQ